MRENGVNGICVDAMLLDGAIGQRPRIRSRNAFQRSAVMEVESPLCLEQAGRDA
jgi:hypothetical protein